MDSEEEKIFKMMVDSVKKTSKSFFDQNLETCWDAAFKDIALNIGRPVTPWEENQAKEFVRKEWGKVLESENAFDRIMGIWDEARQLIANHVFSKYAFPEPPDCSRNHPTNLN